LAAWLTVGATATAIAKAATSDHFPIRLVKLTAISSLD
jgi:hypothetical protein